MNILNEIANNRKACKPVIYGISSTFITAEERMFFSKNGALGFILFARNIDSPQQLKKLTSDLRELMEGEVLILIDQEGGRVSRMQPPHWFEYPSGSYFANLYQNNPTLAMNEIFSNFQKIADDLVDMGINVNCAPLLDVACDITHQVIGDRALGEDPLQIITLAQKVCEALLSKNVYPVIKHIPGHGRGMSDSHHELPIVNASLEELQKIDFAPFVALRQQKFAMTAHILYSAIDKVNCATISRVAIDLIRNQIGFKNILMTDDLSMKALKGSFSERTKMALQAGCDIILHCNGNLNEMQAINQELPIIDDSLKIKLLD